MLQNRPQIRGWLTLTTLHLDFGGLLADGGASMWLIDTGTITSSLVALRRLHLGLRGTHMNPMSLDGLRWCVTLRGTGRVHPSPAPCRVDLDLRGCALQPPALECLRDLCGVPMFGGTPVRRSASVATSAGGQRMRPQIDRSDPLVPMAISLNGEMAIGRQCAWPA